MPKVNLLRKATGRKMPAIDPKMDEPLDKVKVIDTSTYPQQVEQLRADVEAYNTVTGERISDSTAAIITTNDQGEQVPNPVFMEPMTKAELKVRRMLVREQKQKLREEFMKQQLARDKILSDFINKYEPIFKLMEQEEKKKFDKEVLQTFDKETTPTIPLQKVDELVNPPKQTIPNVIGAVPVEIPKAEVGAQKTGDQKIAQSAKPMDQIELDQLAGKFTEQFITKPIYSAPSGSGLSDTQKALDVAAQQEKLQMKIAEESRQPFKASWAVIRERYKKDPELREALIRAIKGQEGLRAGQRELVLTRPDTTEIATITGIDTRVFGNIKQSLRMHEYYTNVKAPTSASAITDDVPSRQSDF